MDQGSRPPAELMEARVEGAGGRIAMRASEWRLIQEGISKNTHFRLMAAFKKFCRGCDSFPEQVFRQVPGSAYERFEEFVAEGVRVIGRRRIVEEIQTFYVTEVRLDAPVPAPAPTVDGPAQASLPLQNIPQRGNE